MIRKSNQHFGAFPYNTDGDYYPTEVKYGQTPTYYDKTEADYVNQTMDMPSEPTIYTMAPVTSVEPSTPVSTEGVQAGLYTEDAHELPSLNLDVPVTTSTQSSGPVTEHFETMTASVPTTTGNKMSTGKKLALGGGLALASYFLLRD